MSNREEIDLIKKELRETCNTITNPHVRKSIEELEEEVQACEIRIAEMEDEKDAMRNQIEYLDYLLATVRQGDLYDEMDVMKGD